MDMKEKLAVLKLAGYEVQYLDQRERWDWNIVENGWPVETSLHYHRAKFEAVNDAFDHLTTNTPKESNT